jgi:hypothetical protein
MIQLLRRYFLGREIKNWKEAVSLDWRISNSNPEIREALKARIENNINSAVTTQDPSEMGRLHTYIRELSQALSLLDIANKKIGDLETKLQVPTQRTILQRASGLILTDDTSRIQEDLMTLNVLMEYPEILGVFYQLRDISTPGFDVYAERVKEWGGLLGYSIANRTLTLIPEAPREGTERSVYVKEQLTPGKIGKWHTHHRYHPIPSAEDLSPFNAFEFDSVPHLIASQNGTRLFIPEVLLDFVDPEFRRRFVEYTPEVRKKEMIALGHRPNNRHVTCTYSPLAYLEL